MNSDMLLNRIRMAQQGLLGVHKKLYTLEHLLPVPDPAQFAETAKSAALLSERNTASLRGFLFTITGGMPEGYYQQAAAVQGIKISATDDYVFVRVPALLPKKKMAEGFKFLVVPLQAAFEEYRSRHTLPHFSECVICIEHIYDRCLPITSVRDGAEIEILPGAFTDAERQTDVTVALVRIDIPRPEYHSEIYSRLKEAAHIEQPQVEAAELTLTDFLENIVQQFNFETDAGIALIQEYLSLRPYLMEKVTPDNRDNCMLTLTVGRKSNSSFPCTNDFLRLTRQKYWDALFHNDKFMGRLTSELRDKYCDMVDKLVNYDFTLFNIQQISLEMNAELSQGIQDTIFKLFERFTEEHAWYPETTKNIHYYNGWKTNKAHKVNSKIILPVNGMFSDHSWVDTFNVSNAEACISDIEKVFDYLDGNMTSYVNLHGVLSRAARAGQTRNIPCKYFDMTLYKKGTMHIRFHSEELLERFNIYCSQGKNWLPPNYGKRTYADMPQEEQAVIDSFHGNGEPGSGKERYAEILAKRDYYLQTPKQDFPLLTS